MKASSERRTFQIGGSRGVTLPSGIEIGERVSMAAHQLLLIDPTGRIPHDKLLEFLTTHVEPEFGRWWERKQPEESAQSQASVQALEANVMGPPVYDATCARCGAHFPWDFSRGGTGFCPYCGAHLWFRL